MFTVRVTKAWNPTDKTTAGHSEIPMKIVANTVEQVLLFLPSTLILATYLEESQMKIMPLFVLSWSVARLAFAYGYLYDPLWRGPGFSLTVVITIMTLGANIYFTHEKGNYLVTFPALAYFLYFLQFFIRLKITALITDRGDK